MSRMSVIGSSVDIEEEGGATGAGSSGNTVVPVITISSEELKAFYQKEYSAHKETRKALKSAKKELKEAKDKNQKLEKELGNKKKQDSKWLRFHEKQQEDEQGLKNAAEPKSPFKIKPIR